MLFSSSTKNNTQVVFISHDGLKDVKEAFINSKLDKKLGAAYLNEIKNWDSKGIWKEQTLYFQIQKIKIQNQSILVLDSVHKTYPIY